MRLVINLFDGLRAGVAIARKLLVVVWHVLSECVVDHHADEDMVAFKLIIGPGSWAKKDALASSASRWAKT